MTRPRLTPPVRFADALPPCAGVWKVTPDIYGRRYAWVNPVRRERGLRRHTPEEAERVFKNGYRLPIDSNITWQGLAKEPK